MKNALPGWEPYGLGYCYGAGEARGEVMRRMNPETHLIEWHALAWRGMLRTGPLIDEYHGQDLASALGAVQEAHS